MSKILTIILCILTVQFMLAQVPTDEGTFDGKMPESFHSEKAKLSFPDASWTFPRDAYHDIEEKDLPSILVC